MMKEFLLPQELPLNSGCGPLITEALVKPTSLSQQRLWFLCQLEPNLLSYNLPVGLRLAGPLDQTTLTQGLNEMISRHALLRTTFVTEGDEPVQIIAPHLSLSLPLVNLSHLPTAQAEAEARCLAAAEIQRPFDLAQGPLLRATLFRLAPTDHLLLLTLHRMVADDESTLILQQELAALYAAFSAGQPSPLPELPCQYGAFALEQQESLADPWQAQHLAYWKQQLDGNLPVAALPLDHPRPPVQSFTAASHRFSLSQTLTVSLQALSRQENANLFDTLLAAFKVLLFRYGGQEDILIGTSFSQRHNPDWQALIGPLDNILVLRSRLSGSLTFRELLRQIQTTVLEAAAHQTVPLEQLIEELQPGRDLSHNPLFQVMFTLQAPTPAAVAAGPSLTITPWSLEKAQTMVDLSLSLLESGDRVNGWLTYNADLFDAATIERMAAHLQTLLTGLTANPDSPIALLPLLTEIEKQQLLVEWNHTGLDFPQDLCLHHLFEQQVERTPEKVAAIFETRSLTYAELNGRANQVAHHLQQLGVGPDTLVAICLERSLNMLVGLLGILKAGGAYVPLDPAYPQDRLAFMLEDSQAALLLTQQSLAGRFAETPIRLVCLDTDGPVTAQQPVQNPASEVNAGQRAYVIYTSGSTGKPKGVQIPHRAAVNFLTSMRHKPGLVEEDILLSVTTLSFDIALLELFLPLSVGARVIIASREAAADGQQLQHLLAHSGSTVMQATPTTWRLLLASGWPGNPRLKILCGGEAMPPDLAQQLLPRCMSLWNMYGPTETTVWSTLQQVQGEHISIGRPIANTQAYILDAHLQPVPTGVPGELHLGGAGLALGYLNRPELTAEKFISNPFIKNEGCEARMKAEEKNPFIPHPSSFRLYKTGDLARYRPDGNIEYLGRIDHQIKIRGFRIELGEIEATLARHPGVKESAVVAREAESLPGVKYLAAYMVPAHPPGPSSSELRAFLSETLPEFMLPSVFVSLEAMPLSPNGKINRKALPAPGSDRPDLAEQFVAPRSPLEESLAALWAGILKVDRVGINDNFFELGGHSLLATQVMSRLRQICQVDLPLRSLFEAPTVARLAQSIEAASEIAGEEVPPLVPVQRDGPLPLSFAQQRIWLLDQLEPGNAAYNLPEALRLTGPLNVAALQASLNHLVQRHESLRTTFAVADGQPFQRIAPSLTLDLPLIDLRSWPAAEREAEAQRLAVIEGQHPFDLSQGPLLRATLLQLAEQEYLLVLVIHHIISDDWSAYVFWRELTTLYDAFSQGRPSPLPELFIQYADFTLWQQRWLQGETLQKHLTYWKSRFDPLPPPLDLPTDHPRPAVESFRGGRHVFRLPAPLMDGLKMVSQQEQATLFMTLLAAFKVLLYRYSGQTDIVVGSPIANRNHSEIEDLIGFFVNNLILRTDLAGNPTFRELLAQVREVCLEAYAHQDLPSEKLIDELHLPRTLGQHPLFQVMFVLQNTPFTTLEFSNLTAEKVRISNQTTPADIILYLAEEDEGLTVVLDYRTDLFDAATISRFADHFQVLLEAVAANPARHLADLPLLTKSEKQQLLIEWNNTYRPYPPAQCLHQLFEAQVERTPNAIAFICGDEQLTYRELNSRANQVAHYLQKLGVGVGTLVGVCLERSLDMASALLGILKAGGAYIPLDPAYPPERLAFMLQDTQTPLVLTRQALARHLPPHQAHSVCLDSDGPAIAQESDQQNPVTLVTPDHPAYIVYTSGSTGTPKGVLGLHRGAVNRFRWMWELFPFEPGEICCQKTTLNFVDSVWEVFGPLLQGIPTVIVPEAVVKDTPRLVAELAVQRVSRTVVVPSLLQLLLELYPDLQNRLPHLKFWVTSGEALTPDLARLFRERMPHSRLINLYGSSEVSADATFYEVPAGQPITCVPIGRPIANTQIYLLDQHLNPAPIGVPGELYVGGEGLAGGYLYRPELTAERFIPNPFVKDEGGRQKTEEETEASYFISPPSSFRLYKTGDIARYLPDGNIEYLGRADYQVKIRGVRIELGEIEATLAQHPAVRQALVVAREDTSGDKRLVAYVIPEIGASPPGENQNLPHLLRQFLQERLTEHMIPAAFVFLPAFPLTPNGKVNRLALPEPAVMEPKSSFASPATQIERELAHLWETLLGVQPVGRHDNFFELGGHSLMAVRMFSQIEQNFGVNLPLSSLFQAATIEHLARLIEQQGRITTWPSLVELQPHGSRPPFFCIHGITGDILWFRELALQLAPDQPFYGIQARGLDGVQPPFDTIEAMAAQYLAEIRAFQPTGPYFLGGASFGGTVALEMSRQLLAQGQQVALLAMFDHAPPNLNGYHPQKVKQALTFLGNFPHWLTSFARLNPAAMAARLQRKLKVGQKIGGHKLSHLDFDPNEFDAADLIDYAAELPEHRQRLIEAHYRAILSYQPSCYPGRVLLLRARAQSLFHTQDPTATWQLLAAGGVDVRMIPGSHEGMFKAPHVEVLAQQLRACLAEAQQG